MEGQRFVDVEVVAFVLEGLFDFSRDFNLDEVVGKRVEVGQVIILVILLDAFARPHLHQLFYELLHLPFVLLLGRFRNAQGGHIKFILTKIIISQS